jgi:hypothetical protein
MDKRHTRSVASNMPLVSGYQFISRQSKSNRRWSAGDGISNLRNLGSAQSNIKLDINTPVSKF